MKKILLALFMTVPLHGMIYLKALVGLATPEDQRQIVVRQVEDMIKKHGTKILYELVPPYYNAQMVAICNERTSLFAPKEDCTALHRFALENCPLDANQTEKLKRLVSAVPLNDKIMAGPLEGLTFATLLQTRMRIAPAAVSYCTQMLTVVQNESRNRKSSIADTITAMSLPLITIIHSYDSGELDLALESVTDIDKLRAFQLAELQRRRVERLNITSLNYM